MSAPAAARSAVAAPQTACAGQWISRTATATVAGLAGIAGAISYSHMRVLALEHGQSGWHAHAFPLSVDGIEIVASLVLLADRRTGRRSGWLPWAALAIGTAGSLAANVATAGPGTISRVIAGRPALALLIAVKLLSGILDHDTGDRPAALPSRPPGNDVGNGDQAASRQAVLPAVPVPDNAPADDPPATPRPGTTVGPRRRPATPAGPGTPNPSLAAGTGTVPGLPPGTAVLLPAARRYRDGHRLTRDALASRLRQDGHAVRNSRLTPLLHALRSETAPSLACR